MSAIRQEMAELLAPMNPEIFEFEDESYLHAGHAGNRGGGHYSVLVVSEVFAGQPRIARWRKVQAAFLPPKGAYRVQYARFSLRALPWALNFMDDLPSWFITHPAPHI